MKPIKRIKELKRLRAEMKIQLENGPEDTKGITACMLILLQERLIDATGMIEDRVELTNLQKQMRPEWEILLPQIRAIAPPIPV